MSDAQREILESLAKSQTAARREVANPAKALLLAADGLASMAVAYEDGGSPSSVVDWRSRFEEEGLARLGRVPADAAVRSLAARRGSSESGLGKRRRPAAKLLKEIETFPRCSKPGAEKGIFPLRST